MSVLVRSSQGRERCNGQAPALAALSARFLMITLDFPESDRSPEAGYPVAIEQNYAVAQWVVHDGTAKGLDATRLAAVGDSVGGNMAAALTLMAKDRIRQAIAFLSQTLAAR